MQTNESIPNAGAVAPRSSIHPLVAVAAVSVIAASAVGIWAMTARTHSNVEAANMAASAPTAPLEVTQAAAEPPAPAAAANATEAQPPASPVKHAASPSHPAKAIGTTSTRTAPPPYAPPVAQAPAQVAAATPAPPAPVVDPTRGRIESIYVTEQKGDSKGVGAVAGGAVGGLVGNSFGRGNGRTAATVLGVVGGALAGNEIEKHARTVKTWHIVVRMDDGSSRTVTQDSAPGWQQGDRVRLADGRMTRPDGSVPAAPKSTTPGTASGDAN